ncbi:thiamine pyrophosphate-binding protein [Hydrogenophaga sp. BPS33]|nr:thiamine pyrophosphate-binding protein [Hydrogenophaga sp. BPS33]
MKHRRPVYEILALDIRTAGAQAVFGLMSDDTALLVSSIDSLGIPFHGARHENNAVAMAEGYASATGRVGIAIVGRGPATANALNGAMFAQRSGARVLIIMGSTPTGSTKPNALGPDSKGFDSQAVLQTAGFRVFTANEPASARATLAKALSAAQDGAAVLLLPTNVQQMHIDIDEAEQAPVAPAPPAASPAARPSLAAAASLLAASRKPLIICGLGAHESGARDAVMRLADRIGAVLASTLKAKDMFRDHPFNAGLIGSFSHSAGRRAFDQADCVLVFGASLNQRTTSFGDAIPAGVPLIQVDRDRSHIGRWWAADVSVVGDARDAAEQLLALLPERSAEEKPLHSDALRHSLQSFDLASEFTSVSTPRTIDPRTLALELDVLLPQVRNAVYDAGNFFQVVPYFGVPGPAHFKATTDFSSIGMGFGTALGFAKARPDETTVLFIGDGGLLMTLGELETVAREDIPLVIVLMNDCAYGAELHYLKERNMPVAKSQFFDIDFAPVAATFGFQTATVRTLEELRALAPLLSAPQGPIFIDCKINGAIPAPFVLEAFDQERKRLASTAS